MKHFMSGVTVLVVCTAASLTVPAPVASAEKAVPSAQLRAPRGPGEIRINVYGPNGEQNASTRCPALFQLFRNGVAVFPQWNLVSGFSPAVPVRGGAGEVTGYSEGDTLYIKGLPAGVYDLHFTRQPGGVPREYVIRPVHISGIVVEAGRVALLEDLKLEPGSTLVQIGKPALLPDPAVNIVDRFNALHAEFTAVQTRLEKVERDNAELRRRLESDVARK